MIHTACTRIRADVCELPRISAAWSTKAIQHHREIWRPSRCCHRDRSQDVVLLRFLSSENHSSAKWVAKGYTPLPEVLSSLPPLIHLVMATPGPPMSMPYCQGTTDLPTTSDSPTIPLQDMTNAGSGGYQIPAEDVTSSLNAYRSRRNLAAQLALKTFSRRERIGSNCRGKLGKTAMNTLKLKPSTIPAWGTIHCNVWRPSWWQTERCETPSTRHVARRRRQWRPKMLSYVVLWLVNYL